MTPFEHLGARRDRKASGSEFERLFRRQTYVILVGVAVMLAGALTPIYLALFAGLGG